MPELILHSVLFDEKDFGKSQKILEESVFRVVENPISLPNRIFGHDGNPVPPPPLFPPIISFISVRYRD